VTPGGLTVRQMTLIRMPGAMACAALFCACLPGPGADGGVDAGPTAPLTWDAAREGGPGRLDGRRPAALSEGADWLSTPALRVDEQGRSGELTLQVPSTAAAVQLMVDSSVDGALVIPLWVEAPDGARWIVDDIEDPAPGHVIASFGFPAQLLSPHRVLAERGFGSWTLPATPDLRLAAGRWHFEVGAFVDGPSGSGVHPAGGEVQVAVLLTEAPEVIALPVVVHLADEGLAAATAADDPVLSAALGTLADVLAGAGIGLEDPVFVDVADTSFRSVMLEDNSCRGGDLDELLAQADVDGALHLFVIERFRCVIGDGSLDVGEQIGGIAGGLPGPGPLARTAQSGVAVATGFAGDDPGRLGAILAHEVGHHLGLFHTKERSRFDAPDLFDIISDTPDDDDSAAANLMYFVAQEDLSLTEGQHEVLRTLAGASR
jgi:hypothetical protein